LVQLYYLRAIANGAFRKNWNLSVPIAANSYHLPDDQLITPLVKQHLAYVEANKAELATRDICLLMTQLNTFYRRNGYPP
jgi:hemolysin activation/secretion protein